MSKYLYRTTRILAVLLVLYNLANRGVNFDLDRNILIFASLVIFLIVSFLYQRKTIFFTPTYLVYFIVVFLIHNVSPYTYLDNNMMLNTVVRNPIARIPSDHYSLYFGVYVGVSIIAIIYLLIKVKTPSNKIQFTLSPNLYEARDILIMTMMLLPVQLLMGSTFRKLLIPSVSYFLINYYMFKSVRLKKTYVIGIILSLLIILYQINWRFITVQYIFPILMAVIIYKSFTTLPRKLKRKEKILLPIGLAGIMSYGIISEMYKLEKLTGVSDIKNVFSNFSLLSSWLERQSYRIFDIWTILGGNIIDYTNNVGFFFGLTYIKFLAPIFGFDYISLPTISANMVGANYAQPGLVAEGYANFGYIGSVLNILGVLILLEIIWKNFINKQSMKNFLLLIVPFTSILLDGGSFNSMIFTIITVHLIFLLRYMKNLIKGKKYGINN
jgi:hypothetical protein